MSNNVDQLQARVAELEEEQTELVNSYHLVIKAITERLEKLEARHFPGATKMVPPPVATDEERLIGRVSFAIMSIEEDDDDDPSFKYTSAAIELGMDLSSLQARAAILEVARWMREQRAECSADRLEQEAGR